MELNMKLTFTNVPFRHNSACVVEKWLLRFERVITVHIYHKYFVMDVK